MCFFCCCRTALHRALYFGHLQAAALLFQYGISASAATTDAQVNLHSPDSWPSSLHAIFLHVNLKSSACSAFTTSGSFTFLDIQRKSQLFQIALTGTSHIQCSLVHALDIWQGRSALDLLSADLAKHDRPAFGETFAWGHGANYQLGTGAIGFQSTPVRLEDMHGQQATAVAASKFHSAALTPTGVLYTWGFGRGGRLGRLRRRRTVAILHMVASWVATSAAAALCICLQKARQICAYHAGLSNHLLLTAHFCTRECQPAAWHTRSSCISLAQAIQSLTSTAAKAQSLCLEQWRRSAG